MASRKKLAIGIFIVLLVIVVVLAVVVPMLVDLDRYRPLAAAHIEEQTGKRAEIGHLALTIFPQISIRVDRFVLHNPTAFPEGDFVKARRIYAVVDARALWNRQVVITSLELSDPSINLVSDPRGKWNFESPPSAKAATDPKGEKPVFTLGVISKVRVTGGQLTATNLLASGRPGPTFLEARGVSSELENVDLNAFTETAAGRVSPSPADRLSGAAGVAYAAAPQPALVAQGTLNADSLRFGALVVTAVKSKIRLFPKQVFFDDLTLNCYNGRATADLALNFAGQNLRFNAAAQVRGVDVARLLEAFPEARGKMTGKMEGNVKLAGEVTHSADPLAGVRGSGQMSIRNGRLPSLQLNRNLMTLARLANLGPTTGDPSSFSSISTDFDIANRRINSNKIIILGNGVDIDGSGSLALGGAGGLDYQGVAKLVAGQTPLSNLLANMSGATFADGRLSFPFNLGGTLQNPRFTLKSGGGAGSPGASAGPGGSSLQPGQTQQPADLVQGIADLFKKKKQQPAPK